MKILQILILGLLAIVGTCSAQNYNPGWYVGEGAGIDSSAQSVLAATNESAFQPAFLQSPPPAIAEAITPDIQTLANDLQDNWQNIYNYVQNNIRYVPYFGSKKGAELTLLEKSGNDFDQCSLLVALLNAAGVANVQYQFGCEGIPYDDPSGHNNDLHHWFNLSFANTNWLYTSNCVAHILNRRDFPVVLTSGTNLFIFQRVWVTFTAGSLTYWVDPAFKQTQIISGISLTNAMGFSSNAVMAAAGGTDTGNYVTNLNEASLRNTLTGYSTNLLNYIQSNYPNASVQQIVGGQQIIPESNISALSTSLGVTVFPPLFSAYSISEGGYTNSPVNLTYMPTNLMSSLTVGFAGTNWQCWIPQLAGERLSLTFSNNGLGQLWLDDSNVVQGQTTGTSRTNNVSLDVNLPIGNWNYANNSLSRIQMYADYNVTNSYQRTNATYALVYAFEPDWGWLQKRQNKLDSYIQSGYSNSSQPVVSETLNVMGLNWMLQTEAAEQMLAQQEGILPEYYERLGRMAEEVGNGYYVDIYMQYSGEVSANGADTNNLDLEHRHADLTSYFGSALESGLIEQLQNSNLVAASAVKMLELANTNGQAVYLASSTNWSAIQGVFSPTYNTTYLYNNYISQGYYLLMPQNGTNHVSGAGTWAGYGIAARQLNSVSYDMSMLISGNYNGGYSASPTVTIVLYVPWTCLTGDNQPPSVALSPVSTFTPTAADPVDTADGTFQVEHTDLTLGQSEPKGITLSRYYNGTRRYMNPTGMAPGWINNYYLTADTIAAPDAALGGTTPAQAAAMLTATCAAINTYSDSPDPKNWLTTALIAKWGVDQLTQGAVSINLGKDIYQFIRQPNGVYTPPANCTMTLTPNGSGYSLQERHGRTFNFNPVGLATNIVDQYGNALTITYTNNLVSTVTDWKNRVLTFGYNANGQLTSISDNSTPSRSISYGYSASGDLTNYTDPEGKTTAYTYDTNHDIIETIDAKNQLVVSNAYDGVGHVTQQYTEGLTNKMWQIFWTGAETIEQDPAGSQRVFYYDNLGRLTEVQDQLTNLSQTVYDGQNHVIKTISPLNEVNQFVYDGNNNLIQTIDPLDYTNQYFFDANNDLVQSIDARGNTNSYGYNAEFSLTGQTNGAGDWVNYTYNSDGTVHTRADSGGTNSYGYDSFGQLNSITYPTGDQETFANSSLGDMTNHVNGRGFATSFQYDNRRELTNSIGPTNLTAKIAFDAVGNKASAMDARGNISTNSWSPTRVLQSITLPSTAQGTPVVTNLYDNRDYLVASYDQLKNETIYTNDLTGKVISTTDPLLRTIRTTYDADGRQIGQTNAMGEKVLQQWNARGQLIKLTDNAGHTVTRAYDGAENQTNLVNRNNKKWLFLYDAANRLTNTVSPLGFSTTVAFNHQGLPAFMEDAKGQITTNTYDGKKRLISRADSIGATLYNYDSNNNVTNVADSGLTNLWTYDAYDRVSSYRDALGNLIQYKYDLNGNMTNMIYPGGRNVYYAYDSNNHMTNVLDWSGRKTSINYDLDGRLTKIVRPNGTQRIISYGVAGQTTNILEANALGFPLALFEFAWNSNSTAQWEFDAPLPHTNAPPSRTMTYDSDNRLATFQLGTGGRLNVGSDADGNMTNAPLNTNTLAAYTYDTRNRLITVGGVTNFYDGMNNRIMQTQGTNVTEYVINPNAKLPQVLMRIKNGVTNFYIYGPGLLYQITEAPTGTNTLTYHYDYRGSTIALSADNGQVTDRMEYSLYATMTYRAGTNDTPFLFNGRYGVQTDPNGLLYMKARYYNPYLCRFINPDPSGFSGGLNFYAAFGGNPVSYLDPSGLNKQTTGDTGYNWTTASAPDPSNPFGLNTSESELNSMYGNNTSPSEILMNPNDTLSSVYPFYSANPSRGGVQGLLMMASLVPVFGEFDLLALGTDLTVEGASGAAAGGGTQLELDFGQTLPWQNGQSGLVIGRGADLSTPGALNPGEFTLRGWVDVQPASANLQVNLENLQNISNLGLPIRDASAIEDVGGFYLNGERSALQSQGWQYQGGFWNPPPSNPY